MLDSVSNFMLKTDRTVFGTPVAGTRKWSQWSILAGLREGL